MKLKYWNYDLGESGGYDEIDHPDEIIKSFMEFVLLNKQWPERLEIMYNRFLKLKRDLTDAENEAAREATEVACTAQTKAGAPCRNTVGVEDGLCHIHRRALVAA